MVLSGHCLCKQVTYTIDVDAPEHVGYDHCDDCQRQSGSSYSLVAVVPKAKLQVSGPTKTYTSPAASGNSVHRVFCNNCGSPISHQSDGGPDIVAVKAGTLSTEDKQKLKPDIEIWTVSKLPFVQEKLDTQFKHMPE